MGTFLPAPVSPASRLSQTSPWPYRKRNIACNLIFHNDTLDIQYIPSSGIWALSQIHYIFPFIYFRPHSLSLSCSAEISITLNFLNFLFDIFQQMLPTNGITFQWNSNFCKKPTFQQLMHLLASIHGKSSRVKSSVAGDKMNWKVSLDLQLN